MNASTTVNSKSLLNLAIALTLNLKLTPNSHPDPQP